MCGAECWTDHNLQISKHAHHPIQTTIKHHTPQVSGILLAQKWRHLIEACTAADEQASVPQTPTEEAEWAYLSKDVYSSASDVIKTTASKHLDWFDNNDSCI